MISRVATADFVNLRSLVWILGKLSILVAVLCVYQIFQTLKAQRATELPETSPLITDVTPVEKAQHTRSEYDVVVSRGILGRAEKPKGATPASAPTQLKLRLVGTNIGNSGAALAIVEDTGKSTQDVFEKDEVIFGQARLVEVLKDSIKVDHAGKIEEIFMEDAKGDTSGVTRDDGDSEDGELEYSVSQEELDGALANLPQLLSQARAVPYFKEGKSIGMRLFAIRQGSLYEKLGLKNGDIIKEVNDTSLTDPAQALKLFEELKSERSIYVNVERNGVDVELSYSIR